jgi:hypothetical protein
VKLEVGAIVFVPGQLNGLGESRRRALVSLGERIGENVESDAVLNNLVTPEDYDR